MMTDLTFLGEVFSSDCQSLFTLTSESKQQSTSRCVICHLIICAPQSRKRAGEHQHPSVIPAVKNLFNLFEIKNVLKYKEIFLVLVNYNNPG